MLTQADESLLFFPLIPCLLWVTLHTGFDVVCSHSTGLNGLDRPRHGQYFPLKTPLHVRPRPSEIVHSLLTATERDLRFENSRVEVRGTGGNCTCFYTSRIQVKSVFQCSLKTERQETRGARLCCTFFFLPSVVFA